MKQYFATERTIRFEWLCSGYGVAGAVVWKFPHGKVKVGKDSISVWKAQKTMAQLSVETPRRIVWCKAENTKS